MNVLSIVLFNDDQRAVELRTRTILAYRNSVLSVPRGGALELESDGGVPPRKMTNIF